MTVSAVMNSNPNRIANLTDWTLEATHVLSDLRILVFTTQSFET